MADFNSVSQAFCQAFYAAFDSGPANVVNFYHPQAVFSFEGDLMQGTEAINKRLSGLTFQQIKHVVTTFDAQPTETEGIIIQVLGQLKTDDDPVKGFTDTFLLKKLPTGNFCVMHHIFRLALHSIAA